MEKKTVFKLIEVSKEQISKWNRLLSMEEVDFAAEGIETDSTLANFEARLNDTYAVEIKIMSGQHNLWVNGFLFKSGNEVGVLEPEHALEGFYFELPDVIYAVEIIPEYVLKEVATFGLCSYDNEARVSATIYQPMVVLDDECTDASAYSSLKELHDTNYQDFRETVYEQLGLRDDSDYPYAIAPGAQFTDFEVSMNGSMVIVNTITKYNV